MATREQKHWQHIEENRVVRQIRKQTGTTRGEEPVRRRDWLSHYGDNGHDLDEMDIPAVERVMPLGEQERRKANVAVVLGQGQTAPRPLPAPKPQQHVLETERGIVVEVSTGLCRVSLADREPLTCEIRRSLTAQNTGFTNIVAVGDEVTVSHNGSGRGLVEAVLPRRSALARPDVFYSHLQQVIVANVDQVLIVAAWREPAFWPELVDRYLIAAERYRLAPIICVNKIDLADDSAEPASALMPYVKLGYPVIFTSARSGAGLAELRMALDGLTTALAGLSGVGKSSLLAAAEPGLQLRTSEVSDRRHEGRHTTTQVTLHALSGGGYVADTPGIREFGLAGLHRKDLAHYYPEIAAIAGNCRFDDCSHTREPGCAVRGALQAGRVTPMRYDSYRKILHTLPE